MRIEHDINGVLLVDKPGGITSAGVVRAIKRRLQPKKVGHGGTLDPLATGLLVILLGKATKLSSKFLEGDKVYSGVIRLGIATDTDDISGEVVETDPATAERFAPKHWPELEAKLRLAFLGETSQVPPAYSAIKVNGKRSYDLARSGQAPLLEARTVQITELDVGFNSDTELRYRVRCSKGTYVRSLARDFGKFLGSCATVQTLCREACGGLLLGDALPLDSIEPETYDKAFISLEKLTAEEAGKLASKRAEGFVEKPDLV